MDAGFLCIILHGHLPYVRHPEHERFYEEQWLFEAITECYIPLWMALERLRRDQIPGRITLSLSPPVITMLRDPFLQERYLAHMDQLIRLAEKESDRTRSEPRVHRLAAMYRALFANTVKVFDQHCRRDLVAAFHAHQQGGRLELATTSATHGFLPLLATEPETVRAQLQVAQHAYREVFGERCRGLWLPECGYTPGLEILVQDAGFEYFVLESHGILNADVQPHLGLRAPVACPNGVVAFGRDPESSRQVWSADEGYPGHPDYREFYRDIGFELDFEYIRPHILDHQTRIFTGIRYHRITSRDQQEKDWYDPVEASKRAAWDAADFVARRRHQIEQFADRMDRPPLVVAPYDAELFGHWWFEGPLFLEAVIREAARLDPPLSLISPTDYLDQYSVFQQLTPSASSWGMDGYYGCWLSEENDWIYPHLHQAGRRLISFADAYHQAPAGSDTERSLNQAARSLLLAQASDWTFLMKTGASVDYSSQRVRDHIARVHYLCDAVEQQAVDQRALTVLEHLDPIFPDIDFRIYRSIENPFPS